MKYGFKKILFPMTYVISIPPKPPRGMELIKPGVICQGDFAASVYSGEWIEVFPDDIGLSVGIYDFVCRQYTPETTQ